MQQLFVRDTGLSVHDWQLREGVPGTTVAQALALSSSQYFATVFKRLRGQSPGDVYRLEKSITLVGKADSETALLRRN